MRPDEPLAGAPDRSPIPLADSMTAGAAAIGASATRARDAAGNGFQRFVWRIQDRLPRRRRGAARVSTASSRMETQRRAAVALLAFVTVGGALALGVYAVGSQRPSTETIRSFKAGQQAFEAAQKALGAVTGPGVDLIANDPKRALELLSAAYAELDKAEQAGYPLAQIKPLRQTALDGLDRLYGMVDVASTDLFTFPEGDKPVSLTGLVRGPDGAPYVLDTAGKTVWRIDLAKKTATAVMKSGQRASGTKVADPKFITTGGPHVLVLDSKNVLWRWSPSNKQGKGTLGKVNVEGSASWGNDVLDIATFVANFDAALYKLYIVDPSEQNIMVMSPRSDGSGYSGPPQRRLPTDRPVDGITDLFIDGDIYVAENGAVARVIPAAGWKVEALADTQLRPTSRYTLLSSPDRPDGSSSRRKGILYAFDAENHRVVAFNKSDGAYVAQYQLGGNDDTWAGLMGMTVLESPDETVPPTLWWISATGVHAVSLAPAASPASPSPTASAATSAAPTKGPTKTPKPTPKP